jgi:hypothetical protein
MRPRMSVVRGSISALAKTLVFTVFVPGTVAGYIPWRLRPTAGVATTGAEEWTAIGMITIGIAMYLYTAFWGFALIGGGTPAPIAPTNFLVVRGLHHFVSLCCRQYKPTYVARRFMWRPPRDPRKDALFGIDKRHITFGSETAKELHDAWVLAPHLSLVPFPARVTGCQRLCLHLKIDFGLNVGSVDGNMPEPYPDRVDVHAST